jgi:hypothetical protein
MQAPNHFLSSVEKVRDILRSIAITDKDSMRHIAIYTLSRSMNLERCRALGIPKEFAWESILETLRKKKGGNQLALDAFYTPSGADYLLTYFDSLFETHAFRFDVKDTAKHAEILEIFDAINLDSRHKATDVLGEIYEQHLGTGSGNSRDLGQFYTDRSLCHYMVSLAKPGFKTPGVPETIWDPSMGTGGLLTAALQSYDGKGVDWSVQQKQIYGCEIAPEVAGLARVNLFLESNGHRFGNLRTYDSLADKNNKLQSGYDIILANPPFGLDKINLKTCCERVQKFKLKTAKSEPLFLLLMMASLNPGGRCVVVLPDGTLNAKQPRHIRKYLLDHFNLMKVIKTDSEFFVNSSIQPSILFFENTGPTTEIEFATVKKVGSTVEETLVRTVSVNMLNEIYAFDARFCHDSPTRYNPKSMHPVVKFGDMFKKPPTNAVHSFNAKDMDGKGSIPFYSGKWNSPTGNHSKASYSNPDSYFVAIKGGGGDHSSDEVGLGMMFVVKGDVAIMGGNIIFIKREDTSLEFDIEYVHFYMRNTIRFLRDMSKKTTNLEHLSDSAFMTFPVILPPLKVQRKLVAQYREHQALIEAKQREIETLKVSQKALFDLVA